MRFTIVLLVSLAFAAGASGSAFERITGEHYQHDGGAKGDAGDSCNSARSLGNETAVRGTLVPVDDPIDFWMVELGSGFVSFRLEPIPPTSGGAALNVDLRVYHPRAPACYHLAGESRNPSGPEVVEFQAFEGGLYKIEVRLGTNPASPPTGLPGAVGLSACHPICTGQAAYELTRS